MNRPNDTNDDSMLEAYLDNTLDPREREALEVRLESDPALREQLELQRRIDRGLANLYPAVDVDSDRAGKLAERLVQSGDATIPISRRAWWLAAAVVGGVALTWWSSEQRPTTPYFEPTPLAQLYRSTLRQGFEPYYECEEPERFTQVFANRLDQPLQLLEMPEGSRMLGLSYPGGLSRDTTAMLCRIDGEPVMVFVDREGADLPEAAHISPELIGTQVFRQQRDGLVYYEVTPFDEPRALDYLVVE